MGAEVGATTSTFPYSANMRAYLSATGRSPVAQAADVAAAQGFLSPDEGAEYDEVLSIVRFTFLPCDAVPKQVRFTESFRARAHYQWTVHTRPGHPDIGVWSFRQGSRLEG